MIKELQPLGNAQMEFSHVMSELVDEDKVNLMILNKGKKRKSNKGRWVSFNTS